MPIPIFDGHNDTVRHLRPYGDSEIDLFLNGGTPGHIDLPRARQGHFGGGMFAVFIPSPPHPDIPDDPGFRLTDVGYEVRLAAPVAHDVALTLAQDDVSGLGRMAAAASGQVRIIHTAAQLESCLQSGSLAMVLHLEGAEMIDEDLTSLDQFYDAGVRSLGIVWSRPNVFGHGVPFQFPSSPDTGPGLTELGKELIVACNALGIMVDLSHMNEKGFWDVAGLTSAPLVATHSAAHAICPSTRNLTDRQLAAIRDSDGMVGVNFELSSTRADSHDNPDTPIAVLIRQIEYLIERLGIDRVGFGSDFDGATMPNAIGDVAGLPVLIDALRDHGMNKDELEKLAWRNWLRVFRETWR